jgi:hypothetical protein
VGLPNARYPFVKLFDTFEQRSIPYLFVFHKKKLSNMESVFRMLGFKRGPSVFWVFEEQNLHAQNSLKQSNIWQNNFWVKFCS